MLTNLRAYFAEMNVAPQLADEMLKTDPSDIRYLSEREQRQFGLTIIDPIELETTSLQQAKELGISRREHIRREALSRARCPADTSFGDCYQSVMKTGSLPLPDLSSLGTPVE